MQSLSNGLASQIKRLKLPLNFKNLAEGALPKLLLPEALRLNLIT